MRLLKTNTDFTKHLNQLNQNDRLAVASSFERIQYVASINNLNVYCFKHPNQIYEYSTKFLIRPHYPFSNELNKFIDRASDGGLIIKWLQRYRFPMKKRVEHILEPFRAENFIAQMGVYFFMLTSAFCALILERFVYRMVRMQNTWRIWRLLEIMIDSERYFLLRDLSLEPSPNIN